MWIFSLERAVMIAFWIIVFKLSVKRDSVSVMTDKHAFTFVDNPSLSPWIASASLAQLAVQHSRCPSSVPPLAREVTTVALQCRRPPPYRFIYISQQEWSIPVWKIRRDPPVCPDLTQSVTLSIAAEIPFTVGHISIAQGEEAGLPVSL
jgi:hypothetical protein